MSRREKIVRLIVLFGALLIAAFAYAPPPAALAQQLGEGMIRSGTVGIQNDDEHKLFWSLICMCGCPRETLGTCTCGTAHATRQELRSQLASGKSIEQIQSDYAARWGYNALAVPPNTGSQRAVWALPLVAILAGAIGVGVALRRWRRRSDDRDRKAAGADGKNQASSERDAYDDKLDDELKRMDE